MYFVVIGDRSSESESEFLLLAIIQAETLLFWAAGRRFLELLNSSPRSVI
jgi:hypothetical protein